ncbi:MAG TPA: hypothetical protein VF898_00865, partial [Chloroflexota bacterium]
MTHSRARQVIPTLIMAGTAAIPVLTAIQIFTHMPAGGSGVALQPSAPVAVAPQRASGATQSSARSSSSGTHTYVGTPVNQPFGPV